MFFNLILIMFKKISRYFVILLSLFMLVSMVIDNDYRLISFVKFLMVFFCGVYLVKNLDRINN